MSEASERDLTTERDLSTPWTLWLPLLPVTVLVVLAILWPRGFDALTYKEGPVEWLTVVVALVGAGAALVAFARRDRLPHPKAGWLLIVFAAGMVYIAGEECSWGQHILNPRLPGDPEEVKNDGLPNIDPRVPTAVTGAEAEAARARLNWLQRLNDQSETNLHNLPGFWGDLFGKLPKQMVEYGSFIACVIIPLFFYRRLGLHDPGRPAHWLMPTRATTVAAAIGFALPWPKRVVELFVDVAPPELRLSEPQELYLAMTLALYAGSLAVRLKPAAEAAADASAVAAPARGAS